MAALSRRFSEGVAAEYRCRQRSAVLTDTPRLSAASSIDDARFVKASSVASRICRRANGVPVKLLNVRLQSRHLNRGRLLAFPLLTTHVELQCGHFGFLLADGFTPDPLDRYYFWPNCSSRPCIR